MPKILNVSNDVISLRQTLLKAQSCVEESMPERSWRAHVDRLQDLIDECDIHLAIGWSEVIRQFNIPDDLKGLRETLCRAQAYIMHDMHPNEFKPHAERLEALIREIDRHRPLDLDGEHRNHTETCGCNDRGHGPWCDHSGCSGCIYSLTRGIACSICGHDWTIRELRIAKCW